MRGSALRSAFRRSSLPWSYPCSKSHIVEPWPVGWVPLSDLALTKMVRAKGLEPPHLAILVPKTSASTNSATPAGAVGRVHDVTDCRARPCGPRGRSEEHTSALQSLMRISYAVFCLKK